MVNYCYSPNDFNDEDFELTKQDKNALHTIGCLSVLSFPVLLVIMFLVSLLFCGCKSIEYVPVETVKTEYVSKTDTLKQVDTVFTEKETIIREADPELIAKLGLQLKDNEKAILVLKRELERQVNKQSEHRVDTLLRTDTIKVPYPVEKKLTKWEQTKMDAGGISIVACIVFIVMIVVGFFIRFARKE